MFKDLTKVKIQGSIFSEGKNSSGFFLIGIFKKVLSYLNIAYVDACCDNNDVTNLPMRFNSTDNTSQYFDSVTNTWVDAPNGSATQDLFLSENDFAGDGLTALTALTVVGITLTSPNNTQYRIVVANDGTLSTQIV